MIQNLSGNGLFTDKAIHIEVLFFGIETIEILISALYNGTFAKSISHIQETSLNVGREGLDPWNFSCGKQIKLVEYLFGSKPFSQLIILTEGPSITLTSCIMSIGYKIASILA